ncbi:hypothetical protein C5689_17080 [Methylosinus sporium]|uniref:Uncharacterized protein n=1 Tax=Methylosinus sporium TaxID=428 RepID=A0A2U1SM21_METSR|nr:hypothetical protein C5689_17080 [Methylosinus sporium]
MAARGPLKCSTLGSVGAKAVCPPLPETAPPLEKVSEVLLPRIKRPSPPFGAVPPPAPPDVVTEVFSVAPPLARSVA